MARHSSTESDRSQNTGTSQKLAVVGIGASAGGLEAFKAFFGEMPVDTGMAFVLIPHLDPDHKSLMVEIIGRHTAMPAAEVEQPMDITPNHIYIVPPNRNLTIEEGRLVPREISRRRGINLPVDFFFRSLAADRNERAIGVILSGTMSDGAMGIKEIKARGGLVIAQDPETAQHDGMPRSAIDTGMVDLVLPIEEMPDAIVKFIAHPYIHGDTRVQDEDEINKVLAVIHARSRHDFRCYKRNTLIRRTERRMGLRRIEKMTDYVDILKAEPNEADALMKDLLIGVTGFFREERVWEKVGAEILPPLLKAADPETPLRIWIPGCSTGEEAYTVAILAHDALGRLDRRFNAQIFATDIDGDAIAAARSGVYPESIAAQVSPEHLKQYFVHEDHSYRVLRNIRESVVFAVQNLIGDAPFSQLDLISCRNLLIYLEPPVQKKVIELFHFALRERGYLVLGRSETVGHRDDLFETVSKEPRIYRAVGRKGERVKIPILPGMPGGRGLPGGMRPEAPRKIENERPSASAGHADGEKSVMRRLENELDATREDLRKTVEELETANEELKASNEEMMSMNEELQSSNEELETSGEELQSLNEELNRVNAELREKVEELENTNNDLVNLMNSTEVVTIFLDLETTIRRFTPSAGKLFNLIPSDVGRPIGDLIRRFSDEDLADHTRQVMETLAPMTKEVKTDDGQWFIRRILPFRTQDNRVDGLVLTFADVTERKGKEAALRKSEEKYRNLFENMLQEVHFWKIVRNEHGAIKTWRLVEVNPAALKAWDKNHTEIIGKTPDEIFSHNATELFMPIVEKIFATGTAYTWEAYFPPTDQFLYMTSVPFGEYFISTGTDITARKKAEEALREAHDFLQQIIDNSLALIVAKNRKSEYILVNEISARLLGLQKDEMIGKTDYDLFPKETADRLTEDDGKVFRTGESLGAEEQFQIGDRRYVFTTTKFPLFDATGELFAICGMATDITERREMESALKESEKRFRAIFEQAAAGIATAMADGRFIEANGALCDMLGYTDEELSEMTVYDITFPEDRQRQIEKDKPVIEGKENTFYLEKRFVHKDGHPVWAQLSSQVIRDEDGNIQYVIGIVVDINEQKRAEAELQKSNALLEATGRMARVGGWALDAATSMVSWTEETCRIHEVPIDHQPPLEEALVFYPPEAREPLTQAIQRALDHGEPYDLEIPFITAKGHPLWVRTICRPEVVDGKTVKLSGTFQDITDRKNAELALQDALAEKVTLLREIHHRVKNNMQAIVSLLRMHARRADDGQLTRTFNDCRDRITAMSLIHEALYQSDDLAHIDFGAYLKKLCRNLGQAYDAKGKGIALTTDVDNVSLNMDQGIAVGMVIAELISNAFKHAFSSDRGGTVTVGMTRLDSQTAELTVADDGKGLPGDFDISSSRSLGMRLVAGAVERELGGTIDVERDNGARFVIRF